MKLLPRLALFAALGPALGFVMGFWAMLPILNVALGEPPNIQIGQVMILPIAYAVGVLPAALVGAVDYLLRNVAWRPLWTGLFGYLVGFLPILTGLIMGFMHGPYVLLFGLIGGVPAVICALVANRVLR